MKDQVLKELQVLTKHENVALINRGNSAILISILQTNGTVFIPKEGGWMDYETIAKALNRKVVHINTTDAKLDLKDLKEQLELENKASKDQDSKNNDSKNTKVAETKHLLLYHSNAAYTIAQDTKEIYEICQQNNCFVAMDVCGAIGTSLCNGHHADITFSSFGKWKLINLESGAFISFKDKELFTKNKVLFKTVNFEANKEEMDKLLTLIKNLPKRIEFLTNRSHEVMGNLMGHNVINKDEKFPFVVLVPFKNETDRLRLAAYCTKHNLEYTLCPREIRILREAFSIEVKRL